MARATNIEPRQEYWRPDVVQTRTRDAGQLLSLHPESCERCDTEFAPGARYCHVCGSGRGREIEQEHRLSWNMARFFDVGRIKAATGLPLAPFIALSIGIFCMAAAALTGFVFSADTLVDWQAIQIWRVEWMLAALTAFAVGILLKK